MKVPKLGVESELQLPAYITATSTPDPSCIWDLHHSLRQSQILNSLSEVSKRTHMRLCQFLNLLSHNSNPKKPEFLKNLFQSSMFSLLSYSVNSSLSNDLFINSNSKHLPSSFYQLQHTMTPGPWRILLKGRQTKCQVVSTFDAANVSITDPHESTCCTSTTRPTTHIWKSPAPTHITDEKLRPKEIRSKGHTVTHKQVLKPKPLYFQSVCVKYMTADGLKKRKTSSRAWKCFLHHWEEGEYLK